MQRFLALGLTLVLALAVGGCGDGKLRTQGRCLRGGTALIPKDDEGIQVTFVPILPNGPAGDWYAAEVDRVTGTFVPTGKDLKGLPPGKYRVAVELIKNNKDLLDGKFNAVKSPFVFEVNSGTKEIVIDLDKPPAA